MNMWKDQKIKSRERTEIISLMKKEMKGKKESAMKEPSLPNQQRNN